MSPFESPIELAVVGENKDDPDQLLLLGDDGQYYAYYLLDDDTRPIEPDVDGEWDVEPSSPDEVFDEGLFA